MKRAKVEKGLYLQTNGVYGTYIQVNGRLQFKTVGRKLAEARRQRTLLLGQADRGELPAATRLTFEQLATTWLEHFEGLVTAGERAPRSLEHYAYLLEKHINPAIGRKRIQEITTDDIAQLIASLRGKGLSGKTVHSSLTPLSRIFKHALRRGYITSNPVDRLERHERPRIQKRDHRVLNHDEIARLLAASSPRYQPLLATATYSGLRLGELLGLTWSDIDLRGGFIHVRQQLGRTPTGAPAGRARPKTPAAVRDIPLLPQLGAILKQLKVASPHSADRDYVFCTADGKPLGFRNVERRALGAAADKARLNPDHIPRLRVHDLRHTFASHLIIDLKLDVAHVSRILGHTRPSVTLDVYTHLFNQAAHADDIRMRMSASEFGNLLGCQTAATGRT